MTTAPSGGASLWISRPAYEAMVNGASRAFPSETGGVLLGYADSADMDLLVEQAVGPGPGAEHRRRSFVPDHAYHELEVARYYEESGRRWSYLGDWHSHPMGPCDLSEADHRTLGRIARAAAARAPRPIMLLLAGGRVERPLRQGHDPRGPAGDEPPARVDATARWRLGCWRMVTPPPRWRPWRGRGTLAMYDCRVFER
jgi:integrative and conjugative element protein (TIGR02256 family)